MVIIELRRVNGSWSGEYTGPTMYGPSQTVSVSFTETYRHNGMVDKCKLKISWLGQEIENQYDSLAVAELAATNRVSVILGSYRKSRYIESEQRYQPAELGVRFAFDHGASLGKVQIQPGAYDVDTSKEAAELIKHRAPKLRERVYQYIHEQGARGATADEVQVALGLTNQTGAPRVTELCRMGRIARTDERRKTRYGRNAGVYLSDVYAKDAESLTDLLKDSMGYDDNEGKGDQ